jgi:hypothetical protein
MFAQTSYLTFIIHFWLERSAGQTNEEAEGDTINRRGVSVSVEESINEAPQWLSHQISFSLSS